MTTLKAECRKFAPNIFNKTKCQNCFRTKDAHSAEALECNRENCILHTLKNMLDGLDGSNFLQQKAGEANYDVIIESYKWATRKVSKCGYLFVAPDWDFSVSINRTKRWQRRWFVLYDDGELTYSVDEHPDTVPQAVIDMNKVLEVSDAEDVTGNQFAIAITAPEKVHFVKGTSREESKWWFDVLCRMPRNTIRGKHKRNATFPGGKATTTTSNNDHVNTSEESGASDLLAPMSRPRFLSTSESTRNRKDWSWLPIDPNDEEDVFPTKENGNYIIENVKASTPNDRNSRTVTEQDLNTRNAENMNNALNKLISVPLSNNNNNRTVSALQNKQQDNKNTENNVVKDEVDGNERNHDSSDNLEVKKGRSRRYLKRENRGLRSQRSRSDGVAKMIPGKETEWSQSESISGAKTYHQNPVYLLLSDNPVMKKFQSIDTTKLSSSSPLSPRRRHTSEKEGVMRYVSINEGKQESQLNEKGLKKSGSLVNIALDSGEHRNRSNGLQRNNSYKGTSIYRESQLANDSSNKHSPYITPMRPVRDTDAEPQSQGDTDTTRTDNLSIGPNSSLEAGIAYCTEDMFVKKGWLMRQNISKEWYRHWFVLRNSSLTYYRDPSAEDCGILDGVLDLNQVTSIEELDCDRNYAFCLMMWDNKKYVLSAVTAGIRNNWIQAIKHASDLWDSESRKDFSKNEIILPEHTFHSTDTKDIEKSSSIPPSPVPSRGEPEKMLDLSSSDDQSEYFSIIDEEEGVDRSSSPRALPPSPPLNRTPMSLVKERARFRSNSHCQTVRQCSLSSTTDSSEMRAEHHSDGTNSDHSSTCTQDSPQWQRKKYRELCCKLAEENCEAASKKEANQYFKEKDEFMNCISKDSLMKESKDEINGTFQMKILEERCKELEVQLELKAKEVNEKTLELDSFKNLKTIYQGLVDKYNSLKKKFLDQSKTALDNVMEDNYRLKYELLKNKYIRDRAEWDNKFKKLNGSSVSTKEGKENTLEEFLKTLQKSKETLNELKNKFNTTEEQTDDRLMMCKEIIKLCEEVEKVSPGFEKRLKRDGEIKKLRKTVTELQSLCTSKEQQLEEQQDKLSTLNLIIEEKEQKLREFQNEFSVKENISSPQNRIIQQDEIFTNASGELGIEQTVTKGDIQLCNECLKFKTKFEMAREQIRRLKKEIKESHAIYDDLEINCFKLKQDMKTTEKRYQSQLSLMTARVDDLTAKFTLSERNFRQLKQKMVKVEAKQERRRSSLKNKEALTLSKECEAKLSELEQKISSIETTLKDDKSWRRDDLPLSSYSQLESDDVNGCSERQLHKRSSQDSTSGSENLSLLLRLHTLGTRVKSATDIVEKQNQEPSKDKDNLERPKICLQVRNDEESSVQDEGAEDWSTLSFTTSMTDLQAIDGLDGEFPCTISECLDCLGQKIDGLISWVRTALQLLQKQEHGTLLGPVKGSFSLNEDAVSVASDLIETLDNLLETKMEDILESTQNGDAISVTMLCYKILLLNETTRILQKLNSSETRLVLQKSSVAECAFRVIERHLQQVIDLGNCNVDISGCTNTLKKLIAVCSTPFHILLDPSLEDLSQTTHHPPRRLLLIEEECTQMMNMLDEARKNLFSILWQTLTDMPVQDDDQLHSNSSCLGENFEHSGLLLSNITIVVNEIFQIADKEMGSLQCQNLSLLWCEHESWNVWYSQTSDFLKEEMQLLLKELKKQCPQVSEDNILSSSFNDATYQKIILIASELAQFTISRTIVVSILSYIKENKDSVHNDKSYKEWLSQLHENYYQKADLLSHGGLSLLAQTLRHFSDETVLKQILRIATKEIKMSEELETAKHFHRKKIESMQNEIESLHTERERLISQGCMKCQETHEEITHLQKELERVLETQKSCEECSSYLTQLHSLNEQHQTEVFTLHEKYNEKIDDLQKHLQLVLEQKEKVHQKEVQKLEIELQSAQKRLNHLEVEYDEQIQSLRELCEQKMSQKQDPINEESVRRRYQTEIEQLRCLCEKGIVAMENSHRRVTLELERRHKQEITLLEAEKEKALAEETQATLTALEVMRKAHAEELQREIAKFKEEFIKRMQIDHQSEVLHKDHGTELDEIKHEILSLSEKYSVKCLECASFEERVTVLSHQLQEANHQLFDLLARNKQLRVHLAMDTGLKREATEGMENAQSVDDLKLLLKLRDSELTEHEEENAQLRQDLHLAQMHVSMLDVQCEQLGQSLKAERRLREDEVSSLRTKLDAIISASAAGEESSHTSERSYRTSKAANRRSLLYRSPSLNLPGHLLELKSRRLLSTSRAKELMRSPSCPGLENSAPSS